MQRLLLIFLLINLTAVNLQAQVNYLSKQDTLRISTYQILADKNYSFSKILNDTTLKYRSDSLSASEHSSYWVKVKISNNYPEDENYVINLSIPLPYRLYFFHPKQQRWQRKSAGLAVANAYRQNGRLKIVFPKDATSTFYLKISMAEAKGAKFAIKPVIFLEKEKSLQHSEQLLTYHLWVSCIVLLSFIVYNFYLYIYLKDKAYLYFMIIQIGAILFLFGVRLYFNVAFPIRVFNVSYMSVERVVYYDINKLAQHIGIFITMWGITQFTRVYLNTKELLPKCDRLLRYLIFGYALMEAIPTFVTITGIFYLDYYTIIYDNLYIQFLLVVILIVGLIAYQHKISTAKYFLLANILPIILVVASSIHSATQFNVDSILPEIAIFSQILTFGVALTARVKLISEELSKKQLEALRLEAEIEITAYQHLILEQENKQVTSLMETEIGKNNVLKGELEVNHRELVGNQIYIHQKNVLLAELAKQVQDIGLSNPHLKPEGLNHIQSSLRENAYLNLQWDKFKLHFERVHPQFFENLKASHPQLTANDLRLCAYLHINLSTKEIASLLHIAPTSVKQAKARLNKKMGGTLPKRGKL